MRRGDGFILTGGGAGIKDLKLDWLHKNVDSRN